MAASNAMQLLEMKATAGASDGMTTPRLTAATRMDASSSSNNRAGLADFAGLRATAPAESAAPAAPVRLEKLSDISDLHTLGLDALKAECQRKGLKCGGTLEERAARLWATRGVPAHLIDRSLLATSSSKKRRRNEGADTASAGFQRQQGPLMQGQGMRMGQKRLPTSRTAQPSQAPPRRVSSADGVDSSMVGGLGYYSAP